MWNWKTKESIFISSWDRFIQLLAELGNFELKDIISKIIMHDKEQLSKNLLWGPQMLINERTKSWPLTKLRSLEKIA